MSNIRQIARTIQVRWYRNNEPVFLQGAPPDAYYTVLSGAVSIYFKLPNGPPEMDTPAHRREYGRFLVQLKKPAGFGELSFQGDYKHTNRNAGVISDGDGKDDTYGGGGSANSSPNSANTFEKYARTA